MDVSMVFMIIFAVVVVGLVLTVGVGQITNIFCYASDAQAAKALKSLESESDNLYVLAEGSGKRFDLGIPADAEFCFVNPSSPGANIIKGWNPDPVVVSMITESRYNIWYRHCSGQNGYKIAYLLPSQNFCVRSGSDVYLENRGTHVDVTGFV